MEAQTCAQPLVLGLKVKGEGQNITKIQPLLGSFKLILPVWF